MPGLEKMKGPLSFPRLYLFSQAILGAKRARKRCIKEYARPRPGMRVLDIGCGPGYVIEYLPTVFYHGFDTSSGYIAYARRKYGQRGNFHCQRFDASVAKELGFFDLVLMAGLLHHLNDSEAFGLLDITSQSMSPEGRLITLDGCYATGQSRAARFLLDRDRGAHIREEKAYVRLASGIFGRVDAHIREDLFSFPYTALVMICTP
jgi:2-polyprenyl-3-methyl-5-hydroxy-6-metoxy-1,4-benzoquinol methylase